MGLDAGAIKELERLVEKGQKPVGVGDLSYWPASERLIVPPGPKTLEVHSLQAFADYVTEAKFVQEEFVVHIKDPTEVELVRHADELYGRRDIPVSSSAIVPQSKIGEFMGQEAFAIWVASEFVDSSERADLLKVAGNIKAEKVDTSRDDGISQEAVVRAGVASLEKELVKLTWWLAPWRTFSDIEQPGGNFLFRLRQSRDESVQMALFSIAEGTWRVQAMAKIKEFLGERLQGWTVLA